MAQEETVMEKLFKTLDEKAKALNEENGQSFMENLGLAMENVYTEQRSLLEQATLQDRRKAFQFAYLNLMQKEDIQANHQITPDSIGMILGFLAARFLKNKEAFHIADIASGAGHLSASVHEVLSEHTMMHHLVEVDPVLSRVSVHLANFLEIPFDVYPQDAIMPLPFEDADVVIGDLPIGYYPLDDRSKEMELGFDEGHSFSHYLLIEQAISALKTSGYAFLVVPSDLFEGTNVKQLQNFIATETEMQAFLNLPSTLFKNEKARKSILILQKKETNVTKPVEVLLANIPDFKSPQQFQAFLQDLNAWMAENHPEN
ncbi:MULTISPECIES: class I SAM-dependent methyltransferase [Staphylococcus]|jgi:site-specific DNA-methyltransferase (adenine-specific)|uniref:Class I SAM-dependent methyltransferase n=1 Tax=Staphylococcus nepalensis TaxID=214473 RepID=A0A2T4SAQ0_9STAP|nr:MULTISPECIES: class I SAM-dependent methyltransferase [Staphylococcus]ATH64940.1 adenine methyltransferase [Staphylococcus nepalensis]AWI44308.1 adenine methyltransferase [Staphylococcus nepalensis]MBO1205210.1 class I SAM-dependent methyltransferase [Staphylococcus nepalensis]MBO1213244.1 class I SAM-dependent methyltransferase [Staphylococcus nepalensis]MBO1215534.1 class I SAM-dependent methyltransferase [Staphylococcus nepalensis]